MINILLIGCGGREHSIAKCLKKNNAVNIICVGSNVNPGILKLASNFICSNISDFMTYKTILKNYKISYAVIGPERALSDGIADYLSKNNIPVIGPIKSYAKIETDKFFCRNLMKKYGLDKYSPKYKYFCYETINNENIEKEYYEIINKFDGYVIKPCGLFGGKGVKLYKDHFKTHEEGLQYAKSLINQSSNFIIEERLVGEEFSLMSFTDSITLKHMPPVKDYKRAYDNDLGPNTGSMGSVTFKNHLLPFLDNDDVSMAKSINEMIINALNSYYNFNPQVSHTKISRDSTDSSSENFTDVFEEDTDLNYLGYKGILYGSFIKTKQGIKVIEYNSRFGDPESINILHILKTDLHSIFQGINNRNLNLVDVEFYKKSSLCKYIVPCGYPDNPVKNEFIDINGLKDSKSDLIYASIEEDSNVQRFLLKGSRALALVSIGDNMNNLIEESNKAASCIKGPIEYRKDIGKFNLSYSDCGVSISNGNLSVEKMKESVKTTYNERVIHKFGDYSGLLNGNNLENDLVLVGSIDGVGTKSSLLPELMGKNAYEVLGQDIVNHSINDILVKNAKPLLFMDYVASSKIDPELISLIVKGMADTCKIHNCPILGGETAEMPGTYKKNEHDIVGSIVGYVDKNKIIDGIKNVEEGSCIIAIPSVSPHTNGYSMIRRIHELNTIPQETLEWLCNPHKSYFKEIQELNNENIPIQALCHVTGGGLIENPPRVIRKNLKIKINIEISKHFKVLQKLGNISDMEMYKTFNCGLGMLVFVNEIYLERSIELLNRFSLQSYLCGKVYKRESGDEQIVFN